ncbi:MAG: YigZ family protein [Tissierellia bacterium]|nr:YigZ family protein [Tissierellia bacterium]
MDNIYRTIHRYGEDEIIINKSRFIGYAMPINSEEEALDFIEKIKTKHRDATHNVYAYVLGKNSNIQRFSDDGEPSGTAGIPTLEVIKKEDLRNIVVVVTRYFGGIKLGSGGLIRAYTRGAKIALDSGIIIEKVLHHKLKIRINYTLYGMIENYLITNGILIEDIVYDDAVNIYVYIKFSEADYFIKTITDLTSGDSSIEYIDEKYLSMKNNKLVK